MSNIENIISIKIMDKHYKVKCHPDETHELQSSASHLNDKMSKLRQSGNITSTDGIAVVAALNLCHELQLLKQEKNQLIQKVEQIQNKIGATIAKNGEYNV